MLNYAHIDGYNSRLMTALSQHSSRLLKAITMTHCLNTYNFSSYQKDPINLVAKPTDREAYSGSPYIHNTYMDSALLKQ